MHTRQTTQRGASTIGLILILAIIGVGAYIGLQYVPLYIEAGTMDAILDNIEKTNERTPATSARKVGDMIDKQLNINQLENLRDSFTILKDDETFIVTVAFERELNLIYEKKIIAYEKSVTLK